MGQDVSEVEEDVRRHEVVPAPSRGEPGADIAQPSGHLGLDVHVDILEGGVQLEGPLRRFAIELLQTRFQANPCPLVQQPHPAEHAHVGEVRQDVVGEEDPVLLDGGSQDLRRRIKWFVEPLAEHAGPLWRVCFRPSACGHRRGRSRDRRGG